MTNPFSETTSTFHRAKCFFSKNDGILRPIWRLFCAPDHAPLLCGTLLAGMGQNTSKVHANTSTVKVMFKPMSSSCIVCKDGRNHKICDRPWEWRRSPKVFTPTFTYEQVVVTVMSASIARSYFQWSSVPLVMLYRLTSSSPKQLLDCVQFTLTLTPISLCSKTMT